MAPSHCELVVQAFRQVPATGAIHRSDRPQSSLSVQAFGSQTPPLQSSLPQCESLVQAHRLLMQVPLSHLPDPVFPVQVSGMHLPAEPPTHVAPLIEQLLLVVQVCTSHVPTTGGRHVAPKPQSLFVLHALLVDTSASADT